MSGRVPLGRLLELFQHLEKFHQHRVRGWRLPGPLLPPSEHHVPMPRAATCWVRAALEPAPLLFLIFLPSQEKAGGGGGKGTVSL